jgi:hypothetical protein
MRILLFVFLLFSSCYTPPLTVSPSIPSKYDAHGKTLVIVTPITWRPVLAQYVHQKIEENFNVEVINTGMDDLRTALLAAHPDYVFLVGDYSIIPTTYLCDDITWSPTFGRSCIYSDQRLGIDDEGKRQFVVGRLLANNLQSVTNYVLKSAIYRSYEPSRHAYLINDRYYDQSDSRVNEIADLLTQSSIISNIAVIEKGDVFDFVDEASGRTVSSFIDSGGDIVGFYGHGASDGWGYNYDIPRNSISPHVGSVNPLVFAMACETARSAPNPPWYPYVDVDGNYVVLPVDNFTAAPDVPSPAAMQASNPSMASQFTSALSAGPMVYIGETVVTSEEYDLLVNFYTQYAMSYGADVTIGDLWGKVEDSGTPDYWAFIGDPSTWFPSR